MSIVNSNKRKVAAIFDKPETCHDCPCVCLCEDGTSFCTLYRKYIIANSVTLSSFVGNVKKANIYDIDGSIPEWCPLQDLTVIGPAKDMEVQ
jgi:hypothetical protein